jgi:SAM-dependent methyltransferase
MSKIKSLSKTFQSKGICGVLELVQNKVFSKKITTIQNKDAYLNYFAGKKGIEIGGPSTVFSTVIPVYQVVETLDGCNFSSETIWEGSIFEGENFNYFENKKGFQYICEASNLATIPSGKYDFLVASHCLEHCANTLKTVKEWLRVVKKGGVLLIIVPDKRYTFDQNRPITTFKHLLDDLENEVDETDMAHLEEILELHDLNRDLAAGTKEQFINRSLANHENRCLHHHVFDFELLRKIYKHNQVKIIDTSFERPNHQIILGIKQ